MYRVFDRKARGFQYIPEMGEWKKMLGYFKSRSNINFAASSAEKCIDRYLIARFVGWNKAMYAAADAIAYSNAELNDLYNKFLDEIESTTAFDDIIFEFDALKDKGVNVKGDATAWLPQQLKNYFREKDITYIAKLKEPFTRHSNELRNGRIWSQGVLITVNPGVDDIEIDFVNHTNEGGGSYGYSAEINGATRYEVSATEITQFIKSELEEEFNF